MATARQSKTYIEYRVLSSRAGTVTDKRYRSERQVNDRIGRLTSSEPWRFYGTERERLRNADDFACCAGTYHDQCGCGGLTMAEETAQKRAELPPIEWIRIETRIVTRHPWCEVTPKFGEALGGWRRPDVQPETAAGEEGSDK